MHMNSNHREIYPRDQLPTAPPKCEAKGCTGCLFAGLPVYSLCEVCVACVCCVQHVRAVCSLCVMLAFCYCNKHHDQTKLGVERVGLLLQVLVHPEEKARQEPEVQGRN